MSCANDEIANLTQEFFDLAVLDAQIMHDHQPNVLKVKDLHAKTSWMEGVSFQLIGFVNQIEMHSTSGTYLTFAHLYYRVCVIFTLFMMVVAYLRESSACQPIKIEHPVNKPTDSLQNPPDVVLQCAKVSMPKKTFIDEFIECFSLRKNMQSLANVDKPGNAVPIVDGFKCVQYQYFLNIIKKLDVTFHVGISFVFVSRSIGCFLVLIFHVYWFNHFAVHNLTMTFSYGEQVLWHWIGATPIIVDVFFTIRLV